MPIGRLGAGCALGLVLIVAARPAAAQATPSDRSPTILWAQCPGEAGGATQTVALSELAWNARPALWFSRDEPLDLDEPAPREWPRLNGRPPLGDLVYYRIKRLKSVSSDDDLAAALREALIAQAAVPDPTPFVTDGHVHPELLADLPLDRTLLDHVKEIAIRYLFYYPRELGVGEHPHDLETIELRLVVENADRFGNPWADEPARVCRQVRVATFYGSAHGLGAYTNVLDFDKVLRENLRSNARHTDPFWPLVVFVEEGKHASAPDRNGDGVFTPGFDVNRYASDAWGIRDTMRANRLSPAFSADTFKQRIPAIRSINLQLGPAEDTAWARATFRRHVKYDYELRRATTDRDVCGPSQGWPSEAERRAAISAYASRLKGLIPDGDPKTKLDEKHFCEGVELDNSFDISDFGHSINWGGARTSFTRFRETFTLSMRGDGELGWAAVVPVELAIPYVGGRVVGRAAMAGVSFDVMSADVLYMRSAVRFADWYFGAGADQYRYDDQDNRIRHWAPAFELGVRFRFPIPPLGLFLGGRVALRANGWPDLDNGRIVYEVGTGIW